MENIIKLIIINNKDNVMNVMIVSKDKDNIIELEVSKNEVDKLSDYSTSKYIDNIYHFRYLYEYLKKHNPLEFNMLNLGNLPINRDESNVTLLIKLCNILAHNGNIVILNSEYFTIVKAPTDYITPNQYECLKSLEHVFIDKNTELESIKMDKNKIKSAKFTGKFENTIEEYVSSLKNDFGKVK